MNLSSTILEYNEQGNTLLLIEPDAAKLYEAAQVKPPPATGAIGGENPYVQTTNTGGRVGEEPATATPPTVHGKSPAVPKAREFNGSVEVNASNAKTRMVEIAQEVINALASDPNANVKVTVEIRAEFPQGVPDQVRRVVSENAASLGFKTKEWD